MVLDYTAIGKRIAKRRRELHLTQARVSEKAEISDQYLSNIERAVSIPSTEVIMRLAAASHDERWRSVAELLRLMDAKKLSLAKNFLQWLSEQDI